MAKRSRSTAVDFTVAELKAMLAAKTQIDELVSRRDKLIADLDKVEKDLAKLLAGGVASRMPVRKMAAGKVAGTAAAKRAANKAPKKTGRKRAVKKLVKKVAKKKTSKNAAPAKKRPTIESVIVGLLAKNGQPMAFKDILSEIQNKRLVKSRATDFSNVLRRTLSTSKRIKRVGRGMYGV